MRPLLPVDERRAAPAFRPGADVVPGLLDGLGHYCSICERPLLEEAFAWDPDPGALVSPYHPRPPGDGCLLLCAICASRQSERDADTRELVLPHESVLVLDDPWAHGAMPPGHGFYYGRDGSVVPVGAGAERTDAYFKLGDRPAVDARARLRGQVAALATQAVPRLDGGQPAELLWLVQLVATTGFLSVWLTQLARWYGPDALEPFVRQALEIEPGFYPGTDWGRLLPPRQVLI